MTRHGTIHLVGGEPRLCATCLHVSMQPVYGYVEDPTEASEVATHCPNCPPQEEDQ